MRAVIVGAGPAGLAASAQLLRAGIDHVVLERGPAPGHTWRHLYDSLTLHTGRHMSALPGLPHSKASPLFLPRQAFVDYLDRYADTFLLPIEVGAEVTRIARAGDGWQVETARGRIDARAVVMATGTVSNPHVPAFPDRNQFRGRVLHSVEYRNVRPFAGRRVLVVGAGNSAGEIASELAAVATVTVAVRSGARAVPREILGIPTQYLARCMATLPKALRQAVVGALASVSALRRGPSVLPLPPATECPEIPLIGFNLVDAIRRGAITLRGAIAGFTRDGVSFADGRQEPFDDVILATGFTAALAALGPLAVVDDCGYGRRVRRVVSADEPGLYFIGHNNDTRGAIFNIGIDAPRLAHELGRT